MSAWIQTGSGRAVDLMNPRPETIDFRVDVAEALARIPRFTGHIRTGPYSVAQHCVIGADHAAKALKSQRLAALFLLHDAHEAYIGNIATPVAAAIATWTLRVAPVSPATVRYAIAGLKAELDTAIHTACALAQPTDAEHDAIKTIDAALMNTERLHLLGPPPRAWGPDVESVEPLPLRGKIAVWPWPKAADEWLDRFTRYVLPLSKTARAA